MIKRIGAWLWKNKAYVAHYAAVGVLFLDPSVQTWAATHLSHGDAFILAGFWGHVLHWANGK